MSNNIENKSNDYNIKLIILGNSTVGKTSFLDQFINNKFNNYQLTTIGFNILSKTINLSNGEKIKITFYDTSGQEKYRSIPINFIRNAQGIVLMYDITEIKSFDNINVWLNTIKNLEGENIVPIILIGNKIDLEDERKISNEKGKEKAKNLKLNFYEISVKDKINIEAPINDLVNQVIKKINNNENVDNDNKKFELVSDNKKDKKDKKKKKKHKKKFC